MSVPYYPGSLYTPNLGLALYSVDSIIAENFVILDAAYGGGSSINVNGNLVENPNLNGTLPAAPAGKSNVIWQYDSNGNVSAYTTGGGGSGAWATLTGDMTETQVAPWDGPTVGTPDTGISRTSAGTLAIGNGTTGDFSGSLKLTSFDSVGTGYVGVAQASLDPNVQFTGALTAASVPATSVFAPGIVGIDQSDGTKQAIGVFGITKVIATNNTTSFHAGIYGEGIVNIAAGKTSQRCIGILAAARAQGAGTNLAVIGVDVFGPTIDAGAVVATAIGVNIELNFGTYSTQPTTLYGIQVNNAGAGYTGTAYYGCYIGGGSAKGTVNYGLYIDSAIGSPAPFLGANDYGVYVQGAIKTFLGGAVQFGASDTGVSRTAAGTLAVGNGATGDFSGTLEATIVNAVTGFQVNSAAASGHYLRGNGTNYIDGTIQAGDLPSSVLINPMTTLGDIIYGGASGAPTRLAGNTTTPREFLTSAGISSAATAPTWSALVSGDIPNNAANTTGTAANLSGTPALPNGTTATTQVATDATTLIATDAFVQNAIDAAAPLLGIPWFNLIDALDYNQVVPWYNNGSPFAIDTGISRISAGVLGIGTGAQGSSNGTIVAASEAIASQIAGTLGTQLATPSAPTISFVGSTSGSPTWSYKLVAYDQFGFETLPSTAGTITGSNTTLSSSNYNVITAPSTLPLGCVGWNVYRTAVATSPTTTGIIGQITTASGTLNDKALPGDGSTVPLWNFTGLITSAASAGAGSCGLLTPFHEPTLMSADTTAVFVGNSTINQLKAIQCYCARTVTVNRMTLDVVQNESGQTANIAIYRGDGGRKLFDVNVSVASTGIVTSTSTGVTGFSFPFTFYAGQTYYIVSSASHASASAYAVTMNGYATIQQNLIGAVHVRYGYCANSTAAGVAPATLGTITYQGAGSFPIACYWEP